MEAEKAAASADLQRTLTTLADELGKRFPHHAMALRGELHGTRLTTDRWNRMAAILSSLVAVPGTFLTPEDHASRNLALEAGNLAKEMALALLGTRNVEYRMGFIASWAQDLRDRMASHADNGKTAQPPAAGTEKG